jgi:hypothetical protein
MRARLLRGYDTGPCISTPLPVVEEKGRKDLDDLLALSIRHRAPDGRQESDVVALSTVGCLRSLEGRKLSVGRLYGMSKPFSLFSTD